MSTDVLGIGDPEVQKLVRAKVKKYFPRGSRRGKNIGDLVNDCNVALLERQRGFDPQRGNRMQFVCVVCESVMLQEWRDQSALKRGSGQRPMSLECSGARGSAATPLATQLTSNGDRRLWRFDESDPAERASWSEFITMLGDVLDSEEMTLLADVANLEIEGTRLLRNWKRGKVERRLKKIKAKILEAEVRNPRAILD